MKANISLNLRPFDTPSGVYAAPFGGPIPPAPAPWTGYQQPPAPPPSPYAEFYIPLKELDEFTLETLCMDFKLNMFEKAGKLFPEEAAPHPLGIVPPLAALENLKARLWIDKGMGYDFHIDGIDHEDIAGAFQEIEAFFKSL